MLVITCYCCTQRIKSRLYPEVPLKASYFLFLDIFCRSIAAANIGAEYIPASICDGNDDENNDFIILFGEAAPLNYPILSVL